jgi:hypothetical protein
MKNKSYQTFESIGTVMWLITDFIWMSGWNLAALLLAVPTGIFLIGACVFYCQNKRSELYVLIASCGWFFMNSLWIASELGHKEMCIWVGKFFFIAASIFVYLSFRAAKKEDGSTDFKRLKIK